MDNKVKTFQKAFLIFTIAQFFMILGLMDYATGIKALSDWLVLFTLCELVGCILMVIASTMLYSYNKNYFYFLISALICAFTIMLYIIAEESTEDFTIAWSRGLAISGDVLMCVAYGYFFLGSKDYFIDNQLDKNVRRCKVSFIFIIVSTIVINIMNFIKTFDVVKTNYIAEAIFKYGVVLFKFITYTFMLVMLILMVIYMHKVRKEVDINGKEEKPEIPQSH